MSPWRKKAFDNKPATQWMSRYCATACPEPAREWQSAAESFCKHYQSPGLLIIQTRSSGGIKRADFSKQEQVNQL
jgi:hypothetical protein